MRLLKTTPQFSRRMVSGPSILVFYERGFEPVCDLIRQVFALHGHDSEVLWTQIAEQGYELSHG